MRQIDINSATTKQLISYIQNEGKRANQRLVSIEKAGEQNTTAYHFLTSSSRYRKVLTRSKSGHAKIVVDTRKKSIQELRRIAGAIHGFMGAQTSTIKGIKLQRSRSYEAFRKNSKVNISQREWSDIMTTQGLQSLKDKFGSDIIVKLLRIANATGTSHDDVVVDVIRSQSDFKTFEEIDQYLRRKFPDTEFTPVGTIEI